MGVPLASCAFAVFTLVFSAREACAIDAPALRYSGNPDYPPYHWCHDHRSFTGASVEQLQRILPARVKLLPQLYPWKRVLQRAENGQIDIILPLRINADRARYLRFSQTPAFENPIAVFVRKDKHILYDGWHSLKSYRGGISLGDIFGDGFDEYLAAYLTVETASDMASNFRKLELGRIDYFVTGRYVGMAYLKKRQLADIITDLPNPVSVSKIHIGFGKFVPDDVINDIDKALRKMADSGASTALLKKWVNIYAESKGSDCF
ncbi:transporter substrate-binding domain-containing protein [Vogesella sp. DC21W]|uniref:Transporter substrate-binding domain-containing protein n=1 Tax=Vogesella aquatica TaxID=2984206 RepID=A0ABT5IYK7_9NEIS|nr:transporter substrate-binding domain-containing protein [Vogesella aquatica]MDC7717365.1 transporter substrate-binding domain-containing protein [Vogesella aquatica]